MPRLLAAVLAIALAGAAQNIAAESPEFYWKLLGQFTRGANFELGRGVPQDYAEAARWYRRAAERGYPPAQNKLGQFYTRGHGVPRSEIEAFVWYSLAAASGYDHAIEPLNALLQRLPLDEIAEARQRVRDWRPTAE